MARSGFNYGFWMSLLVVSAITMTADAAGSRSSRHAHRGNACTMIPPNNQVHAIGNRTGINEKMFNTILDQVEKLYAPILEAKGKKLVVKRFWTDDTVNAYAEQEGNNWMISMFGGLARHQETTPDAFAMVACHELGHHLGGAPKYSFMSWASTEGQSDYYATLKCMRKVLEGLDNWPTIRRMAQQDDIDPLVIKRCKIGQNSTREEFAMCVRGAVGGRQLARLLADLGGDPMPEYNTPDQTVVSQTMEGHPPAQCRLDTYFAGAVCPASHKIDPDDNDPAIGSCMVEKLARGMSRDEKRLAIANVLGVRPACWFKDSNTHLRRPRMAYR